MNDPNATEGQDILSTPADVVRLTHADYAFAIGAVLDHLEQQQLASQRIYDALLTLIAAQGDAETAKKLQTMHEQGDFLYPPRDMQENDSE